MNNTKLEILLNYSEKRSGYDGYLFANGKSEISKHKKITFLSEVFYAEVCKLKLISSTSASKLIDALSQEKESTSLLVCFNGSDKDFLQIKQSLKDKPKWNCVLFKEGLRYIIRLYWDFASNDNFFCNATLVSEEVFKSKPITKVKNKEESNANVNLPKPGNNKKTDK